MASIKTEAPTPVIPADGTAGRGIGAAVALLRPRQWVKNLAVLLPFLDTRVWGHASLPHLAAAVAAFALASSFVYTLNDIADRHSDRLHPVKRHRPIASGAIPVPLAAAAGAACLAGAVAIALTVMPLLLAPIGAYVAINAAYSRWLRRRPVIELFTVAVGFPLRALCGYLALQTAPSGLVLLSTLFLSLLLVLGKRRRELDVAADGHRPALRGYSAALLDQLVSLTAGLAAATFLLFALRGPAAAGDTGPLPLMVVPLLVLALFRYLQRLALRGGDGDPTRMLLRDPVLVAVAIGCVLVLAATAVFSGPSALVGSN